MPKFYRQFTTYLLSAIILKIMMALNLMLSIKFINPSQFGKLALLNNLIILLPIIFGLGLRQVLAIEFFKVQKPWQLIWELCLTYLVFTLPLLSGLLLKIDLINQILFLNQANHYLILLVFIISFLNFGPELLFQVLRFEQKAFLLSVIQTLMGLFLGAITIALLYFTKLNIISVLLAQLITQASVSIYFIYLLIKNKNNFHCPNWRQIKFYLKIGLPFVPNIILAWLILATNRWILNWYTNLETVGIYSLSENISLIFQTVITMPLMHSFLPAAFDSFAKLPNQLLILDQKYSRYANYLILFCVLIIPTGLLISKPILCYFLPPKYWPALSLIGPLLMAQAVFAGTFLTSALIQYCKKTYLLTFGLLIGAISAILLNILLIPSYGPTSCAIAINCAYLIYFGWILIIKKYLLAALK